MTSLKTLTKKKKKMADASADFYKENKTRTIIRNLNRVLNKTQRDTIHYH